MLSYKRIRKISEMFDSNSIQMNIPDHTSVAFDADMDWSYNALNFPSSEFYTDQFDFGIEDFEPLSPQSQIRNHDCMWSGRCTTHPNECLNSRNNCNKKLVTQNQETKSTQPQQQQKQQQQPQQQQNNTASLLQTQKLNVQQKKQQNIPAGQSLLRLKHVKPTAIRVPNITTNDFLNDRDFIARPDTPLSLDDDPPEFKHNIDLVQACTVGSNKMSLIDESPTEIINILKEHLEDTSSNRAPKVTGYMSSIGADSDDLNEIINDIKCMSDFESEDDEEAEESDATNDSFNVSNTMVTIPTQNPASVKNTITAYDIAQSMHSDHSYTRSKSRVDVIGLGVQTPSDSEEEIDVVSVGDKNLPTNPSARDRRALQNKITSRMVKTTTGIHTIARRRISNGSSDDSAYGSKGSPEIASPNAGSPIRLVVSNGARKRASQAAAASSPSPSPSAKRSKVSKQQKISSPPNGRVSLGATAARRNHSPVVEVGEELETIEKRNLHNDMERQRRIGLKNLFENLKDKIPSLREKERAPKVNILREATNLCTKLTQEDREYEQQLKRRHRLQQRLKYLREQLAARGMY
ncbi:myc protein [Sitodiplosis mosellana]|uniref:myc protein n=1 Tax=Sitodiplosis mosellana TaxID=263140 RepID=UPI0024452220|nr:myc protein [Sitodiplosis mosellana]